MAGSYEHILGGWSLIENMGDAQEAIEELTWLVERAIGRGEAIDLLDDEYYPMVRGEKEPDMSFMAVKQLMEL